MKRKKVTSEVEEKIVTAMIVSNEFLSQLAPVIDPNLLTADHFRKIAGWCVKYFNRYHKAPKHHIEHIYASWSEKDTAKEETVDAVHDVLSKLSSDYSEDDYNNVPYLLDEASAHLSALKLGRIRDDLENALLDKDIATAEKAIHSYSALELGVGVGIDMFEDEKAWEKAFSTSTKSLFQVGGPETAHFWQNAFCRDNLIAVLGPEKRGKTFWCCEFAMRALMARRKVALFEVGDMSESQIMKRMAVRFAGKPMFRKQCGVITIPRAIRKRKGKVQLKRKTIRIRKPVTNKDRKLAMKKFKRRYGLAKERTYFMTSVHPNSTLNVAGINGILDKWQVEKDFIPDVIIIDYADILAREPSARGGEIRDSINETWKALRRLSQERHCLVIAPTQADSMSYDIDTLTMKNFSEDKRKLSHVTGMLGLNQTPEEKMLNIMRLNWIVLREAPFSVDKCLYVGQCLNLARAFCCSYY